MACKKYSPCTYAQIIIEYIILVIIIGRCFMVTKRIKKALPIVLIAILLVGALTISLVSFIPSVSEITVLAYDNIR